MTQGGANDTIWLIQWQIIYDFNFSKQNSCPFFKKIFTSYSVRPRGSLLKKWGAHDKIGFIQWQKMYDLNFSKHNSCSFFKKIFISYSVRPRGSLLKKGDQTTKLASFDSFSFVLHIFT